MVAIAFPLRSRTENARNASTPSSDRHGVVLHAQRTAFFLAEGRETTKRSPSFGFPIYRIGFLVPSSELDRHLQARRQLPLGQSRCLIYPLSKFDGEGYQHRDTTSHCHSAVFAQVVDVRKRVNPCRLQPAFRSRVDVRTSTDTCHAERRPCQWRSVPIPVSCDAAKSLIIGSPRRPVPAAPVGS